MADAATLNLLDKQLDEASQKYIQESIEAWKESVTNQLVEQMEQEKQAKLEELEEENAAYREQLKEEFTEKMLDGLNELKESIRAEVTAGVINNNPELKMGTQESETQVMFINSCRALLFTVTHRSHMRIFETSISIPF